MEPLNITPDEEKPLQFLLSDIVHLYFKYLFGKVKHLGIHPGQIPLLLCLGNEDGVSQQQLCQQMNIRPPTVTVAIQRLEKAGMLYRVQDKTDQRVSLIYLTEQGRDIHRQLQLNQIESQDWITRGISPEELVSFRQTLIHLKTNILQGKPEGKSSSS